MVARWSGLRSWRSDDVQTFQRSALPVLLAGQRQVASLTTTYLERLYRDIAGESSRVLLDFDRVTGPALRGIPLETEYERPFTQVWTALSNGEPFDVALQRGEARLSSLVKTDLQLARTHTAREVTDQQPGVQYTIRVPIGEYNCALCLVAATQRYRKKDLLPIHPGCDCIVKTVKADFDPGQVIDEQRLEAIHAAIEAAGEKARLDIAAAATARAEAERLAQEATRRALVLEVAMDKGLTSAQAARLQGSTKEEMEADADELLALFVPAGTQPVGPRHVAGPPVNGASGKTVSAGEARYHAKFGTPTT
jgi:hypothetical protein